MQVHWEFMECHPDIENEVRTAWGEHQGGLEELLKSLPPEKQAAHLLVDCRTEPGRCSFRATLPLPMATLFADAVNRDPRSAVDEVVDALARQIKEHKRQLHEQREPHRKARLREDLRAAVPLLERDVAEGRSEHFFRLLGPLTRFLSTHARRELRVLEIEEAVPGGEYSPAELVDEVLMGAWDRFAERPRSKPLDLWLLDLLHEVLGRWGDGPQPVSLTEEEPRGYGFEDQPTVVEEGEASREWWQDILEEEETPITEQQVFDLLGREPWEQVDMGDLQDRLYDELARLPEDRRHAFALNVLEGYSVEEIAHLQHRPETEIRSAIESVTEAVRTRLAEVAAFRSPGEAKE